MPDITNLTSEYINSKYTRFEPAHLHTAVQIMSIALHLFDKSKFVQNASLSLITNRS